MMPDHDIEGVNINGIPFNILENDEKLKCLLCSINDEEPFCYKYYFSKIYKCERNHG